MNVRFPCTLFWSTALILVSGNAAAAGPTKEQCIAANTNGQSLRRDHKLAEAGEQFKACSDPACPGIVASDCTKRLDELEAAQPTIIFDAKDGSGHDLSVVKVSIDKAAFVDKLDGTPLRVEPGSHVFTFEVPGQPPVTQMFVIKEGEKERHEKVVIGTPPPSLGLSTGSATDPPPPPSERATPSLWKDWTPVRTAGAIGAGVGVAGLAAGAIFGFMATANWKNAQNECGTPTNCTARGQALSDHDTAETDATIATIGLVAGGALLVGGVLTFFLGGHSSRHEATTARQTGVTLAPAAGPGGPGFLLSGQF
jgi:hypothetical protein